MENKLPEGWEWKKLGEISEKPQYGYTTSAKKEGDFPLFVRTTDLKNGEVKWEEVPFCQEPPEDENKYQLRDEDILVSRAGSVGESVVVINPPRSIFASYLIRLSLKNGTLPKYAGYFLNSKLFKSQMECFTSGTTLRGLNAANLAKIEIPVPPLETQKKIVSILEKTEETKKRRAQADELTQQLLQSVFLEMFGDPITNLKNWKEIKLKDVSEIVSGATKGRKLSGKSTVFVPYLRVANVQDGYLNLTEIKDIEVLPSDVEKYALQDGDILLTEGGDPDKLGRGAVWNRQIPTCIHQNHIFRVRVDRECLIPEYLSMLIGSAYGKMYFLKSAKQTTGIASINSTQLKNFPALIAPLDLQLKFAEMVHQIEKTTESQKQSSLEINNLFDALMQKTFTGELVS